MDEKLNNITNSLPTLTRPAVGEDSFVKQKYSKFEDDYTSRIASLEKKLNHQDERLQTFYKSYQDDLKGMNSSVQNEVRVRMAGTIEFVKNSIDNVENKIATQLADFALNQPS